MLYQIRLVIGALTLGVSLALSQVSLAGEIVASGVGHHATAIESGSQNLKVTPMPPTQQYLKPRAAKKTPGVVEVPKFQWGYFGARYHYPGGSHIGYYGDTVTWWFKKR